MSSIWMKPISGPKAWRGDTLSRDTSWLVPFTPEEIADIDRALATAKASGRRLEDIGREQFPLTVTRARLEQTVAELYDGCGFVVLRGLPVDRYRDEDVELVFWGLGRYMGARPSTKIPRAICSATSTTMAAPTATSTCGVTRRVPISPITPTRGMWSASSACAAPSRAG